MLGEMVLEREVLWERGVFELLGMIRFLVSFGLGWIGLLTLAGRLERLERVVNTVVQRLDGLVPTTSVPGPVQAASLIIGNRNAVSDETVPPETGSTAPVFVIRDVAREMGASPYDQQLSNASTVVQKRASDIIDSGMVEVEDAASLLTLFVLGSSFTLKALLIYTIKILGTLWPLGSISRDHPSGYIVSRDEKITSVAMCLLFDCRASHNARIRFQTSAPALPRSKITLIHRALGCSTDHRILSGCTCFVFMVDDDRTGSVEYR